MSELDISESRRLARARARSSASGCSRVCSTTPTIAEPRRTTTQRDGPARRSRGVLLVLAGTSGAGKGTIGAPPARAGPGAAVVGLVDDAAAAGADETDGVDYHFVTREEFERLRDAGGFLEWFEVYGDLKGTPAPVRRRRARRRPRRACSRSTCRARWRSARRMPEALLVFVQAPSPGGAAAPARGPGQPTIPRPIERRLARADGRGADRRASEFDAVVVNDDVDRAAAEVAAILEARRNGAR